MIGIDPQSEQRDLVFQSEADPGIHGPFGAAALDTKRHCRRFIGPDIEGRRQKHRRVRGLREGYSCTTGEALSPQPDRESSIGSTKVGLARRLMHPPDEAHAWRRVAARPALARQVLADQSELEKSIIRVPA